MEQKQDTLLVPTQNIYRFYLIAPEPFHTAGHWEQYGHSFESNLLSMASYGRKELTPSRKCKF